MFVSNAEAHLRRARIIDDPRSAIEEYAKAIDEAVKALKASQPFVRMHRRR